MSKTRILPIPVRYSDDYINYWGEVYTSRPEIHDRGILFEAFLFAPVEFLRIVERRQQEHIRLNSGLLPKQRAVQRFLDDTHQAFGLAKPETSEKECRMFCASATNANREPLAHHRYPRKKLPGLRARVVRILANVARWRTGAP